MTLRNDKGRRVLPTWLPACRKQTVRRQKRGFRGDPSQILRLFATNIIRALEQKAF